MLTDAITPDLPSRVEETLAACPNFRIVLVGNSGVGKSSLVSSVFNISLKDIDISHHRPGKADIQFGYTSVENPRFVLHDSQGFEAGCTENWDKVEKFLRERNVRELKDKVHAIWLCIEAPRDGSRLEQTGDEKLLSLAKELDVAVILVFTKYDNLVREQHYINAKGKGAKLSEDKVHQNAETCFNDRIKECKAFKQATSIVKVSTNEAYPQRLETLRELTNVTRGCLVDTEGPLVPWIIVQRISARQKVEISVSEGFKKYWRNLGKSLFFQGHTMNQCVFRIHDDILKVWNFNDPHKLLFQQDFFTKMLQLVSPVLEGHDAEVPNIDTVRQSAGAVAGTVAVMGAASPHFMLGAGIATAGVLALKFLYGKYQMIPLNARYLGVYIVDLTCVLRLLFIETLALEPPRALSEELISSTVASYKQLDSWRVHKLVFEMNVFHGFEEKIKILISEYTDADDLPPSTRVPQDETLPQSVANSRKGSKAQKKGARRPGVEREEKDGCIVM